MIVAAQLQPESTPASGLLDLDALMVDASAVLSQAHLLSQAGHHAEAVKATDAAAAMIEQAQAQYTGLLAQLQLRSPQKQAQAGPHSPQAPQAVLASLGTAAGWSEPPSWTHVAPPDAAFPVTGPRLPQLRPAACNGHAAPGVPAAALGYVQAVAAQWVLWRDAADDTEGEPEVSSTWRSDKDTA